MAVSARIVLHESKTTFLLLLMPLFFVLGCLLLLLAAGVPRRLRTPVDSSGEESIAIAWAAGVGMPILAVGLWLFIPAVTTTYDPGRRVVQMEYRRPLGRSVREYRVDEIADFRPGRIGRRTYSLHMVLKSGQAVRLEYSASSDLQGKRQTAERLKAVVGIGEARQQVVI